MSPPTRSAGGGFQAVLLDSRPPVAAHGRADRIRPEPKRNMRTNLFTRIAPMLAVAAFAGTASAQDFGGAGISVAGEGKAGVGVAAAGGDRAALFTSSALVAPKGKFGISLQAAGMRASADEGGVDISATQTAMAVSGFYGVTNRLSIGAFVPYTRVSLEVDGESGSESGMADAGLFGRFQAYKSQSGMTKMSLGALVTLPTGDDLFTNDETTFGINGALSHTAGLWNMHVAPQVNIVDGFDPGYDINVAAVRSMSERLAWSAEVLSSFGGAVSDVDGAEGAQDIDLATGFRYRLVNSALDFGLRYNVNSNIDPKPTMFGMYVGWNYAF